MNILLDTHTFLWWLDGDASLVQLARGAIANTDNEVFVSAASAWEIATKFRIGKLAGAEKVARDVSGCMRSQGFHGLAVTVDHAQRAGLLPGPHRDPFDRMLIAQALADNLTLVSNEALFDHYSVQRLWQ